MGTTTCFSDPYAHWLPETLAGLAGTDAEQIANLFVAAGDLVPVVVRATNDAHVDEIVKELEASGKGLGEKWESHGQFRNHTSFASLLINRQVVKAWLQKFEARGIRYEIGAPFSSQAAMIPIAAIPVAAKPVAVAPSEQVHLKSKAKKIIGIIDYGCAFANEKFCNTTIAGKRSTRVLAIWDQHQREPSVSTVKNGYNTLSWGETTSYGYGVQALREWETQPNKLGLNAYLQQFDKGPLFDDILCYQYANYPALELREATHGTYIMDFAAGIPSPLNELTDDWAAKEDKAVAGADIIFVQLPRNFRGEQVSGVLRTYVLDAIMYIVRAAEPDADVVINLSYGGFAGPHDGTSLIEQAIDDQIAFRNSSQRGKTEIVVCSGNSASSDMHTFRQLKPEDDAGDQASIELSVIPDNPSLQFVEMWIDAFAAAGGNETKASVSITLPDQSNAIDVQNVQIGSGHTFPLINSQKIVIGKICLPKPDPLGVGAGGYRVLIGLNPTVLAAGASLYGGESLAPIGVWQVKMKNLSKHQLNWSAWCERHDPVFGSGYGPRQIKFVNDTSVLATTSNLATTGGKRVVVGGSVLQSPDFMAEYTGRGPYRQLEIYPRRHEIGATQDEIDREIIYAPSEENLAYLPLAGAGVLGQSKVRYSGTSVSAAVVTRMLISGSTVADLEALHKPGKARQVFP